MAYTTIVSLKQTVEGLLNLSQPRIPIPNSELEHILEDLRSLKLFFDKISSLQDSNSFEELGKKFKDVLQNTQDLIESHVSDRFHSGSKDECSDLEFSEKLRKVKAQLSSFTKRLGNKEEYCNTGVQQPNNSFATDALSSKIESVEEKKMIGMHDELMKLKQRLLRESRHKTISIIGMAGIGKTTLAKKVLNDPIVLNIFPVRLFVPIGPKYELKELLVLALSQAGFRIEELTEKQDEELGEYLYQFLENKRYLVVLDDMWDNVAWNELQQFFPDDNDESRIIWTTRMPDVIRRAGIGENAFEIRFLTAPESWALLCETVFPDGLCPPELEKAGKKIVKNCEGLPLAIVEVGEHLREADLTVEYWTEAAENVNSGIYQSISKFLSPTYKSLPQHLKACFLYMGVFPTNYEIPTSRLLKLWIAEGFIDRLSYDFVEQKAEEYLMDLVSRSLVIVHELSSRGRVKTCRIHFVYRNLCVNEARNEKLFHIVEHRLFGFPEGKTDQRRLCIHNNIPLGFKLVRSSMESCAAARSLICLGPLHQHPLRVYLGFGLLRVLHTLAISFCKFPDEVLKLVQLRYLAITCDGELPSSISRLLDLEFLIVHQNQRINPSRTPVYLPVEIWKLQKLMHLECMGFDLPEPSTAMGDGDSLYLEKLLTLSGVSAHSCTQGVLSRMPNLTKLRIWFDPMHHAFLSFNVFNHLHRLESFKFISVNLHHLGSPLVSSTTPFPVNLTKITLRGCGFLWEYINVFAKLPNLEVLKLQWYAFRGPKWEARDKGFLRLKFLLLEDLDIEYWGAHSTQFSQLRSLIARRCYKLEEIPSQLGEILTLERIELVDCSPLATASATQILETQRAFGNDALQLTLLSALD